MKQIKQQSLVMFVPTFMPLLLNSKMNMLRYYHYYYTNLLLFGLIIMQVIPGTDEGVYGWITVNYLLKILQQSTPVPFGALDIHPIIPTFLYFYTLLFMLKIC